MSVTDQIPQRRTSAPETDPDTQWWWDALRQGELYLPHCLSCARTHFPPTPSCPHCGSTDVDRKLASGRGTVYSWVVIHSPADPAFAEDAPYTVVAVHMDGGARLFGRITNGPLHDGMPVEALVYTVDDIALLGFRRV